jgi:site-specific DNA-methyltransferase (adenine-specific)
MDCWYFRRENGSFKSRVDYPVQMPVPLLERLIVVASNAGELVLDPMCGPGTTLVAAKRMGRHFLGIDLAEKATAIARQRLDNETRPLILG